MRRLTGGMVEDERGKEEVVLTKAEQRKMRKIELRNQELEARFSHDMDIYRENATEIIDLRTRLAYIEELVVEISQTMKVF